jgi:hypothetical protein
MLEFVDQTTGCVIDEVPVEVESVEQIGALLMIEPAEFDPRLQYELDGDDIARIKGALKIRMEGEGGCAYLRPRRPTDDLPYKIHTNRELTLMLAGSKPLAAFVEDYPRAVVHEVIPEKAFEPYVLSGRFVKREKLYSGSEAGGPRSDAPRRSIRRVLYAQKDEAWRIDAYLLLHEVAVYSGWSDGFERMEGTLLGYEQWQNDAYLRMIRARQKT